MPRRAEILTHRLINRERKKRKLAPVKWSSGMYNLAKAHSRKMAKAGRLFHSGRPALQGGENVCGGKGYISPQGFVKTWMKSSGHRAWLLSPDVRIAAVGISRSRRGTYGAWSFSSTPLLRPGKGGGGRPISIGVLIKRGIRRLFSPYLISQSLKLRLVRGAIDLVSIALSIALIIYGIHGLYVYFHPIEALLSPNATALFLSVQMPAQLQGIIEWMTVKGIQSWFIPSIFIVLGICVWYWLPRGLFWLVRNILW
jgi:hypothetical protein